MEKSVQVINIAPAQAKGKVNTGTANEQGGENSVFSAVLAPAQADAAAATPRQTTAGEGNALPATGQQGVSQEEQAALLALLGETDSAVTQTDVSAQPVIALIPETASSAAVPLQQVVSAAAGQPAEAGLKAAAASTHQQQLALPLAVQATLTGVRDNATAAVVNTSELVTGEAAARQAPATAAQAPIATEPGGQAVRVAVQEVLAAQAGRGGQGQQSLAGNAQGTNIPGSIVSTQASDAAVTSFSSIFGETTTINTAARIAVPVGEPGWGRALGDQVAWHVSRNIQSASLRLNPQHLGPMEMQVNMDGDRATIAFASSHAVVRDALESALPRLREMFAQNGISLADVNVSEQETTGRGEQEQGNAGMQSLSGEDEEIASQEAQLATSQRVTQSVGLFDGYA